MKDRNKANAEQNRIDSKFSVLMCVYKNDNSEHFKEALESIVNQTRRPDEIILVVDGPVAECINEVINSYAGLSFLKVIRLPKNVGHGNARKIGLESCSNELIALMDADDISVYDRFEKQINCFEQDKNISIVGGNIKEFINSVDSIVGVREVPQDDDVIKSFMKKRCPFNHMTVMFKMSSVIKAGGYKDWFYNEDYFLWIRMYQSGAVFKNLRDSLVLVRVGEEMYQRRGGWKYFVSEAKLQYFMYKNEIIKLPRLIINLCIRFIIQVAITNRVRSFVYQKILRNN